MDKMAIKELGYEVAAANKLGKKGTNAVEWLTESKEGKEAFDEMYNEYISDKKTIELIDLVQFWENALNEFCG